MEKLLPFAFLVFFPLLWCCVSLLIASIGGWSALAAHFRATEPPDGKAYYMQSAKVGLANYGSCLTIRVCEAGLYLAAVFPLLPVGHPPLLIPWQEFNSYREKRILFWRFAEVCVGMPIITKLQLRLGILPEEVARAGRPLD